VQDPLGNIINTPKNIIGTFVTHLREKYRPIDVDSSIAMMGAIQPTCPATYVDILERPITTEEILDALRTGSRDKTPRGDGIGLEFYTSQWETTRTDLHEIMNQIFLHMNITPQQKHGIITCLPKPSGAETPG
jgi:hypothetical protein